MVHLVGALLLWTLAVSLSNAQEFNFEVEKRILERLDFYLGGPVASVEVIKNFHENNGFAHDMDARDRDPFLTLAYSVSQPLVYMGREDGLCTGYYWSHGYYREPGNSGYSTNNLEMEKHFTSCVDGETGNSTLCLLESGSNYISCKDGIGDESGICQRMERCPSQSQPECEDTDEECKKQLKWCREYTIETIPEGSNEQQKQSQSSGLGYVPITNMCMNKQGRFSQTANDVIAQDGGDRDTTEFTTCHFGNGDPVQRYTTGSYAACGSEKDECHTAFVGGYSSSEYDPRYRPWYIEIKEKQKPVWLPPYPFFSLGIGITYAQPFYSIDEITGRNVFDGVIAVDYRFEDIANFLIENYENTSTAVAVYEIADPNHLIATSTGSPAAENFLTEDLSKPCPVDRGDDIPCTPVRIPVANLEGNPMDIVLAKAVVASAEAGYPQDLTGFRISGGTDEGFYVSQSTVYTHPRAELSWRIVVVSPGGQGEYDTLVFGKFGFFFVCVLAILGAVISSLFLWVIFSKRKEKEVAYCDWKFTCAFIFGCILLNLSTFSLLGNNTDGMCILRMWTFHLSFVVALAPLFAKVWRIWKYVGSKMVRRVAISNKMTVAYMMPIILLQVLILTIFTFADPPSETKYIRIGDGMVVQHIVCGTNTKAFLITEVVYEAGLIAFGCVLAYLTRDMQDALGEARQLIFSMYNIAFVGLILLIITQIANLEESGVSILQTIGVFWGTLFSSSVFVIPRLVQIRQRESLRISSHASVKNRRQGESSNLSKVASFVSGTNKSDQREAFDAPPLVPDRALSLLENGNASEDQFDSADTPPQVPRRMVSLLENDKTVGQSHDESCSSKAPISREFIISFDAPSQLPHRLLSSIGESLESISEDHQINTFDALPAVPERMESLVENEQDSEQLVGRQGGMFTKAAAGVGFQALPPPLQQMFRDDKLPSKPCRVTSQDANTDNRGGNGATESISEGFSTIINNSSSSNLPTGGCFTTAQQKPAMQSSSTDSSTMKVVLPDCVPHKPCRMVSKGRCDSGAGSTNDDDKSYKSIFSEGTVSTNGDDKSNKSDVSEVTTVWGNLSGDCTYIKISDETILDDDIIKQRIISLCRPDKLPARPSRVISNEATQEYKK